MELKIEFVKKIPEEPNKEAYAVYVNGELNPNYPYYITKGTFNYFGWKVETQIIYNRDFDIVKNEIIKHIESDYNRLKAEADRKAFFDNFKPEIIEVATKEQFNFLYDNWAMTWEGLVEEDFVRAMKEAGDTGVKGYKITGEAMNKMYHLKGSNAYKEDLNIFAIYPFRGLAMMYGARWFTDIVDNNKRRNS